MMRSTTSLFHIQVFLCLVFSLLVLPNTCFAANGKLLQLFVLHRHGARPPLTKTPHDLSNEKESKDPGALYEEGKDQLQRLGSYIRKTYLSGSTGFTDLTIDERHVLAFSSNFGRTLESSRAFLSGLLPNSYSRVPTLLFNNDGSKDWIIRGYATCPMLNQKSLDFRDTDEYVAKRKEEEEFVVKLAKDLKIEESEANFEHVFNVYDQYTIVKSYDDTPHDHKIKDLPAESMKRLTAIANWYESHRFHFAADVDAAQGLLRNIVERMAEMEEMLDDEMDDMNVPRIVEYSAHYPTLLTLFASLRRDASDDLLPPADVIPGFGAALMIELRESTGEASSGGSAGKVVDFFWFKGGAVSSVETEKVVIGGECGDSEQDCKLDVFKTFTSENASSMQFCKDCETEDGKCFAKSDLTQIGVFDPPSRRRYALVGAVPAVGGFLVGLVLAYILYKCTGKSKSPVISREVDDGQGIPAERGEWEG